MQDALLRRKRSKQNRKTRICMDRLMPSKCKDMHELLIHTISIRRLIVIEMTWKKLAAWVAKTLSYGDRLVLINSVLTSLPMFLLSFFEIPKGVRKRLDFYRSRFFWQSNQLKRRYRLTKWNLVCRPKDQGVLGISVLEV